VWLQPHHFTANVGRKKFKNIFLNFEVPTSYGYDVNRVVSKVRIKDLEQSDASVSKAQYLLSAINGGSLFIRNFGMHLADYRVSQPQGVTARKENCSQYSPQRKSQISQFIS
jgi:hypothetical protein